MSFRGVLLGACLFVAGSAWALDTSFEPNASEMARMPEYCKVKFRSPQGSPEWLAWRDRMGRNFIDIHHYCAALNFMNRYWGATDARARSHYLRSALDNFSYMVKAESPDFPLRAELYSNRGEVFKLQGRPGEAERDFRHALELDPRLTRPYLQLIDLYEGRKQRKAALETATLGLRHNPESKAMQRRYLELGGAKPFPEPFVAEVKPEVEPVVPDQPPASEPGAAAPVAPAAPEPETMVAPPAAIGTPKNPYCRFCPPE